MITPKVPFFRPDPGRPEIVEITDVALDGRGGAR